ncbi:MAG TPA: SCO family protein [Rickettsiales bacterium]|nr:SCO family protein [Rickettsiales bacterium]
MPKIHWIAGGIIALVTASILLFTFSGNKWELRNVKGRVSDLHFSLIDDTGKHVNEGNYRGNILLLYFGFTGCPQQCSLTLERLNHVLSQLGNDANYVQVLFVSINPANDTSPVLHNYLARFHSSNITGLTGSESEIKQLALRLHATHKPGSRDSGDLPHSSAVYIFNAAGKARLLATPEDTDEKIVHDLRRMIHAS